MFRMLATVVMVLAASTAMAGWGHYGVVVAPVVPVPAVTYYAPPVPVVTYYAPACPCDAAPVVAAPVVPAPPVFVPAPAFVPAPVGVVPGRYSVRFYPYGQPVRNAIRVLLP